MNLKEINLIFALQIYFEQSSNLIKFPGYYQFIFYNLIFIKNYY